MNKCLGTIWGSIHILLTSGIQGVFAKPCRNPAVLRMPNWKSGSQLQDAHMHDQHAHRRRQHMNEQYAKSNTALQALTRKPKIVHCSMPDFHTAASVVSTYSTYHYADLSSPASSWLAASVACASSCVKGSACRGGGNPGGIAPPCDSSNPPLSLSTSAGVLLCVLS